MLRTLTSCATVAVIFVTSVAAAAEFDPSSNSLRWSDDALMRVGFESASDLGGGEVSIFRPGAGGFLELSVERDQAKALEGRFTSPPDAIEGGAALRIGERGRGVVFRDSARFAEWAKRRVEVSVWARSEGATPMLEVVYARADWPLYSGFYAFAAVRGIRTGRETTDGWVEYSTGPIDGSAWGVPIRAIALAPAATGGGVGNAMLVDALEVRPHDGAPTEARACTQQTAREACGAGGECLYGRCVPPSLAWGPLPPPAHRMEIAERWIQYGTAFHADRNSLRLARELSFADNARALARESVSGAQFFGGLQRLVNALRDNHTSLGIAPSFFTFLAPQVANGWSSALGACFGQVEKDIAGGGLGYAVYQATTSPIGVPLRRGDLLVEVDGRPANEWVDAMYPAYALTLPNDPRATPSNAAPDLASLLSARANEITVLRCASAERCDEGARELVKVPIATRVFDALTRNGFYDYRGFVSCSPRFSDTVQGGVPQPDGFEDAVVSSTVGDVVRVQFDGFSAGPSWKQKMTEVVSARPSRLLFDAREGRGGTVGGVEHLFDLLRGREDPVLVFTVGRSGYDEPDRPGLVSSLLPCLDQRDTLRCVGSVAYGVTARADAPPGAAAKIAWLNTRGVSANDFLPRLIAGRANVRIFGPTPTAGAFGGVTPVPVLVDGWFGGSIQIQDARFARDVSALDGARWESGFGVEPDAVVVQKLSDTLLGSDSILSAAEEWLR